MRAIIIFIFLLSSGFIKAQEYSNLGVSAYMGVGLLKDQNILKSCDLEIYKHLGLGIYSTFIFGSGQSVTPSDIALFDGSPDLQNGFRNILSYKNYGFGISKSLYVSKKSNVKMTINGLWVQKDAFYLDSLKYTVDRSIDLLNTKTLFSEESGISYSLMIDYQIFLSQNLSLGFYGRYQEQIESVLFGLKINTKLTKESSSKVSESDYRIPNSLGVQLGIGKGDGGHDLISYDFNYSRHIGSRLSLVTKLSLANGGKRLKKAPFYEVDKEVFLLKNLDQSSDSDPIVLPRTFRSLGIGAKYKINATERASINLYAGGRYYIQTISEMLIDRKDEIEDSNQYLLGGETKSFSPEIGVSYKHQLNSIFYLEANIDLLTTPIILFFSLQAGVNF